MNNNYNYILNGISHKINIDSNIKIQSEPLEEKKLLSNKFILKIINDLLEYLNIDYCLINKTLLGQKIFKGVNIFEDNIEIIIQKNNIKKILKEEEYLKNNNIFLKIIEDKYIIFETSMFNNIDVKCYLYLYNEENNKIYFLDNKNILYNFDFYDIYPIKKDIYEEFNVSIPNKIDTVLINCNLNLNFLHFKTNKSIIKNYLERNQNVCKTILYLIFLINFEYILNKFWA